MHQVSVTCVLRERQLIAYSNIIFVISVEIEDGILVTLLLQNVFASIFVETIVLLRVIVSILRTWPPCLILSLDLSSSKFIFIV